MLTARTVTKHRPSAKRPAASDAPRPTNKRQPLHAFTLLEVLLAITIAGIVLAAASTMLVSVTNIWSDRQQSNFFDDHVDGVTEFMQSCFIRAGTEVALEPNDTNRGGTNPGEAGGGDTANPPPPAIRGNISAGGRIPTGNQRNQSTADRGSLLRVSEEPVGWGKPPGAATHDEPSLSFKLAETPPLLVNTDNAPVVGVNAFLHFDDREGLSLLWYSLLQEEAEDENDLRRTAVSPYVTGMKYIYWDERFERWDELDEPQEGENDEFLLPRFIKLIFEHKEITKERMLTIPVPSRSALLF